MPVTRPGHSRYPASHPLLRKTTTVTQDTDQRLTPLEPYGQAYSNSLRSTTEEIGSHRTVTQLGCPGYSSGVSTGSCTRFKSSSIMPANDSNMLPPFRVRSIVPLQWHGESNSMASAAMANPPAIEELGSTTAVDRLHATNEARYADGIIRMAKSEYEELVKQNPQAALRYIDESDDEVILVSPPLPSLPCPSLTHSHRSAAFSSSISAYKSPSAIKSDLRSVPIASSIVLNHCVICTPLMWSGNKMLLTLGERCIQEVRGRRYREEKSSIWQYRSPSASHHRSHETRPRGPWVRHIRYTRRGGLHMAS